MCFIYLKFPVFSCRWTYYLAILFQQNLSIFMAPFHHDIKAQWYTLTYVSHLKLYYHNSSSRPPDFSYSHKVWSNVAQLTESASFFLFKMQFNTCCIIHLIGYLKKYLFLQHSRFVSMGFLPVDKEKRLNTTGIFVLSNAFIILQQKTNLNLIKTYVKKRFL